MVRLEETFFGVCSWMRKMYDRTPHEHLGLIEALALPKNLPDRNNSPDPRGWTLKQTLLRDLQVLRSSGWMILGLSGHHLPGST